MQAVSQQIFKIVAETRRITFNRLSVDVIADKPKGAKTIETIEFNTQVSSRDGYHTSPHVSPKSMELDLNIHLMSTIPAYAVNHLIVTLLRAYLRFKKYSNYYKSVGRKKGAYIRAINKRILKPTTFFYALLLTLAQYLFFNFLA